MNKKFLVRIVCCLLLSSLISSCTRQETVASSSEDVSSLATVSETVDETTAETTSNFVELPSDMSQPAPVVPLGDNGFTAPEPGFDITRLLNIQGTKMYRSYGWNLWSRLSPARG